MPLYIVLAAAAVAISIPLLIGSVASRRTASGGIFERRAERGEQTYDSGELILDRAATERLIAPALSGAAGFLRRFTPGGVVDTIERRLVLSGRIGRWSTELILVIKVVLAAGLGVAGFLLTGWLLAIGGALVGYVLPDLALDAAARNRQHDIERALPDTLDHITMTVEAGIGFEAALGRAAKAGHGPLAEELRRTLHEMQIGLTRSESLRHLADRSSVIDVKTFVAAVVQSEEYGLPIAHVLRTQAHELRLRRRQRAEERALKIPVKMVFPLVFCIFPALFVVLLGPAAIRIARVFVG